MIDNVGTDGVVRLREACNNLSDTLEGCITIAYKILSRVLSGKVRLIDGDVDDIKAFIYCYNEFFSRPIEFEDIMSYDTSLQPEDEGYDYLLAYARERYEKLHQIYCDLSVSVLLSVTGLEDIEPLNSLTSDGEPGSLEDLLKQWQSLETSGQYEGSDLLAIRAAIGKCRSIGTKELCYQLWPDKDWHSTKGQLSRCKKRAKKIACVEGIAVPPWNQKERKGGTKEREAETKERE